MADDEIQVEMAKSARIVRHGYTGQRHIEINGVQIPWFTGGNPPTITTGGSNAVNELTFTVLVDGDIEVVFDHELDKSRTASTMVSDIRKRHKE